MRWKSFLRFFRRAWTKRQPLHRRENSSRRSRLVVELLESRELLAAGIPSLVPGGILPIDGSSTPTGTPQLQVQYSEPMTNSVLNPNNYYLIGAAGTPVPVNNVTSLVGPSNTIVQLSYNSALPLVVDTYTLYVRGQNMIDQDEGFAMAQPGQLIVANGGRNNVGVVNLPGDGTLGSLANYNLLPIGATARTPVVSASADVSGDGLEDLLILSRGTETIDIFAGRAAINGGGFSQSPDYTIGMPAGTATFIRDIGIADFDGDGDLDIAALNYDNDTLSIFVNLRVSAGTLVFDLGTSYTTDPSPTGLAIADLDGDNILDIAVTLFANPTDLNADAVNDYRIQVFPGQAGGVFGAPLQFRVGDAAGGLVQPFDIAAGLLDETSLLPQLVAGGPQGVFPIRNTSTPGTFNLTVQPSITTTQIGNNGLTIGQYDAGNSIDVAIAGGAVGRMEVLLNTGNMIFQAPVLYTFGSGLQGQVISGDLSGDGHDEVIVPGGPATSTVAVMKAATIGGSITAATNTNPIIVTSARHGLTVGQNYTVLISGSVGNTAANGLRTITVLDADRFQLNTIAGNGAYTGGGMWSLQNTITNAAGTAANQPIVITTPSTDGLFTGARVTIAGSAFGAANGTFTITVTSPTTFVLNAPGVVGSGAGGTWTTTTSFVAPQTRTIGTASTPGGVSQPITITTNSTTGLTTGNIVRIAGNSLAAANGTFMITVTGGTSFTLNGTNTTLATNGLGGTWSTVTDFALAATAYGTDGGPVGATLLDSNQDGFLDLVTANQTAASATLLFGTGDGRLQLSANYGLAPTVTRDVAVADLNADDIPDLVVINNNGMTSNSFVSVFQGLNGGGYAAAVNYSPYTSFVNGWTSVTIGDIDNDANGRPDIILSAGGSDKIGFLINNTTAGAQIVGTSFTAIGTIDTGRTPKQVVTGDFNEDGKLDLVLAHNASGGGPGNNEGIEYYRGNGDGTFQNASRYDDNNGMDGVVAGDFNRDGDLDFVGIRDTGDIFVHYGDGVGNFTAFGGGNDGFSFPASIPNPTAIDAADFNGDGFLDVIVTSGDVGPAGVGVSVLLNVLGTSFAAALQSDVVPGTALQDVITNDINQDGFADAIVTTQLNAGTVGIQDIRNSGGLIEIRNFSNHGLTTGDQVTITGATGVPAANGTWTITVTSGSRFTLDTSVWPGGFYTGGASWSQVTTGITTNNNVYVLIGNGTGRFLSPVPYLIGGTGGPLLAPSYLGATDSPLLRVTTFDSGGNLVAANLIINGDFETRDLNNELGSLLGWQTYKLNLGSGGSHGDYRLQTLDESPLSSTTVPAPSGSFSAMLDQSPGYNNPNRPSTYEGTHLLYQDVTIPAVGPGETVKLSMSLFADNSDYPGGWTDTSLGGPTLNYTDVTALRPENHQVRVDIMATHGITGAINAGAAVPAVTLGGAINANSIVITSPAHGLTTGTEVQIVGVQGLVAANGIWKITRIDANRFSLNFSVSSGTYAGGGYWTRLLSINAPAASGDLLLNAFITTNTTPTVFTQQLTNIDLTAFAGQTIRLRIASSNNLGRLLVGVDNVKLVTQYSDNSAPTLAGLGVRNPAFFEPVTNIPHTGDATLTGVIADNSSIAGVKFVQFDLDGDGFETTDPKTNQWDATGHFSFTLPNPKLGLNTIPVRVVDRAGNITSTTYKFFMQSNSVTEWQAIGPQGIAVDASQGVDYDKVAGRVTVVVPDRNDPTGNSYFVGSANGGIWRSTNGGFDWTPVTNSVVNNAGSPIPVSIGGMAQSRSNPNVLYAGTGVGDRQLGSQPGVGVLKSIDGGKTWTIAGNSDTVMLNARTTRVVVDLDNPNVAYVSVASDFSGTRGAIYKTTDGGATWNNVLVPTRMTNAAGSLLLAGTPISSVTDLVIDPFNSSRLFAGVGNIGVDSVSMADPASTGGMWVSTNFGLDWYQEAGGDNPAFPAFGVTGSGMLPTGSGVGRVTIAMGNGRPGDETTIYILVGSPPGNNTPPNVNFGNFLAGPEPGLYKGVDGLLDFTKVMLKQDISGPGAHNFVDINLMGQDAANAGALAVDPTNANVVYVGGSTFWRNPLSLTPHHNFLRVDTGNMRDTTFQDPRLGFTVPNDGDDIDKADEGERRAGFYDNIGPTPTTLDPYIGEGVYWYDLTENQSGDDGNVTLLPNQILSLAFDAQGRLLVGTSGGIWRGAALGFDYDDTSGNDGILAGGGGPGPGPAPFNVPAMTFTSINGNLQIADMTSVAVDSVTRGVYYTTQYGTGVAKFDTVAGWVSQGLTGPLVNGVNLNIPNAAAVLAADPPPGSAAGTPVTLFRIWQFADPLALRPEVSSDNGVTWDSIAAGGINQTGNLAGFFPGFAVNPNTINLSGIDQNQLLYGTNRVYLTSTSGIVWDAKPAPPPAPPLSSAGGLITAMSFAPSGQNIFYVGTDLGELFYTNDGGGTWVQRGFATLPTTRLNALAVDPNNENIVYAMYGGNTGAAGHVWKSIDAGVTWVDLRTLSTTLPNVAAYSGVIDPAPNLGAANGKIYVATQVGVYYSLNGGNTWSPLGKGMPNVPVVDLKYSAAHNVLAAATLGRGVYTINTAALSFLPDQVIDEDTTSPAIPFTVNDPGLPANSYTVTAVSNNQALIPNGNIVVGGSGSNRTIQFTPKLHANSNGPVNNVGPANITVTVTSSTFSFSQVFQVTVNFVNYAPTVPNFASQTTMVDQPLTINFGISDVETPAGALTVSAVSNNQAVIPDANLVLGGSGGNRSLVITPTSGATGTAQVTLTVTDADGAFTIRLIDVLVTQPITLPYTDDFTRNNDIFLGAGWNTERITAFNTTTKVATISTTGGFSVLTNKANAPGTTGTAPVGTSIATLNQLAEADVALQANVSITGIGEDIGLMARYSGNGAKNYYIARVYKTGAAFTAGIFINDNGAETLLASGPVSSGTGVLRFEVVGASLKLFFQPTSAVPPAPPPFTTSLPLVAFAINTKFTLPGTVGLVTKKGNVTVDDFSAEKIVLTSPTLPLNDGFNTNNGDQLTRDWSSQLGNFTVNNAAILASTAVDNIATVNGVQTDTFVQADISLTTVGQTGGVIARYTASGYYYAELKQSKATETLVTIYKVTKSGKTALSPSVDIADSTATLKLEVAGPSLRLYVNGALQPTVYGYDPEFASGMNGVRASANVTIDEYQSDAIALTAPALPFTEAFAQADGPLSRNWNDKAGFFQVAGNVLVGGPGSTLHVAAINGVLDDSAAEADVTLSAATNQEAGVIVRYNGNNNYYVGEVYSKTVNNQVKYYAGIFKVTNGGSKTALGIAALAVELTPPVAGTVRLEAAGPSLKLFFKGTQVAYGFDTAFTTGTSGVRLTTGSTISRVSLDAVDLLTPGFPFTDNFAQADGTPLSRNWTERGGSYGVEGGVLTGDDASTTSLNFATVNAMVLDTVVQADIAIPAPPTATTVQQAQLVARYNPTTKVGYVARINHSGAKVTAGLYRLNADNTLTALTTVFPVSNLLQTTNGAYSATVRLEVVGRSIKMFVDGTLCAYAFDGGLTAPGLDGVRSTKDVTFANFQADAITFPPTSFPFTDSLSQPDGSQLSYSWDERAGNFTAQTNTLVASGPATTNTTTTSFATVRGLAAANVAVQADVTVAAGQRAQLVARYDTVTGVGYLAEVYNSGTNTSAALYLLNANGTTTALTNTLPLGTGVMATGSPVVNGTLRLEIANGDLKLFFQELSPTPDAAMNLAVYAYNTKLTNPGLVGVRGTKGAAFANFSADQITLNTPPLPFTDIFNPTALNQLAYDWLDRTGNFRIETNAITGTNSGINLATVNLAGPGLADGAIDLDVSVPAVSGRYAGVVARHGASGYYTAQIRYTGSAYVAEILKSTSTTALASKTLNSGGIETLRLEFAGPSLKLYVGGILEVFTYDSTFTTGAVGVRATGAPLNTVNRLAVIPALSNFGVSVITLNAPTLPFNDSFGLPDGSSISRDWTERSGLFQTVSGDLTVVNATAVNLATVNATPIGDVFADANYVLGGVNLNSAGVVARFSTNTAGAPSYYLGHIEKNGTGFKAYINKVSNGTSTTLVSKSVANANTGLLHMEVAGNSIKLFLDGLIIAYANDATPLAAGLVGVRTINSAVSDFNADAIALLSPALPFTDSFAQPIDSQLSLNWLNRAGNYEVGNSGNDVAGDSDVASAGSLSGSTVAIGPSNIATVNGMNLGATTASVDVSVGAINANAGLVARYNPATREYYYARIINVPVSASAPTGNLAQIYKFVKNSSGGLTATQLASASVPVGTGKLTFETVGSSLKLFYEYNNPTPPPAGLVTILAVYAHDATLATGATGIASTKGVILDDFTTDAIAVPVTQTIPFNANFAANPPKNQLPVDWTERAGNFDLAGGVAQGKATANLATVNGISAADVDLTATFGPLTTIGQQAALVARYSGPLDTNYYLGTITYTAANVYTLAIYKKVGSTLTKIAAPVTTITSFAGDLRFQVVGNTLKLYSGTASITVTDTALTTGGVGIRTTKDVQAINFNAS